MIDGFTILIATRSALGALKMTLGALVKNSRLKNEIIIVGTKSHPRIKKYIEDNKTFLSDNNMRYCEVKKHDCFVAYNYGIDLATKDYILFLQDDMYLTPEWDINMAKCVSEDRVVYFLFTCPPDIGVARIYGDRVTFCDCGKPPVILKDGTLMGTFDEEKYINFFNQIKRDGIDHNWAPSLIPYIMSKQLFLRLGKYLVGLPQHLSGEESNFVGRISEKKQAEIIRCLNAGVFHIRSVTVKQLIEDGECMYDEYDWEVKI